MKHQSHPAIIKRLKRAHGHLASVIEMIEVGRPCTELAQQLHAVHNAIANAKAALIRDHIDHCLEDVANGSGRSAANALAEFKKLTQYL